MDSISISGIGIMFSTCPFVCSQSCECCILKTDKPIFMPIGTIGPLGRGVKRSRVQRSQSHQAVGRFGGQVEVLLSTLLS